MTPRQSLDDHLASWLDDGPTQAPATLLAAIRTSVPATPQRRRTLWHLGRRPAFVAFAQAVAAIAVLAVAGLGVLYLAAGPGSRGVGGVAGPPSASPSSLPAASSAATLPVASQAAVPTNPAPVTTPSPTATVPVACGPANTVARITSWQGAAGQRIATVELTSTSAAPCTLPAQSRPQLVDASGQVLIDSPAAAASAVIILAAGAHLTTLVEDGNYCGPAPVAPVEIALTLSAGERVVASAPTPTDATVPPCNGAGAGSYIRMHPWGG
jgi:hypothetical protein